MNTGAGCFINTLPFGPMEPVLLPLLAMSQHS